MDKKATLPNQVPCYWSVGRTVATSTITGLISPVLGWALGRRIVMSFPTQSLLSRDSGPKNGDQSFSTDTALDYVHYGAESNRGALGAHLVSAVLRQIK